jgi:hypothetical protein
MRWLKNLDGVHRSRARLGAHPGVEGWLPTAGLPWGELHGRAGAPQHLNDRFPDFRVQGIDDAGDKKLYSCIHANNCIPKP